MSATMLAMVVVIAAVVHAFCTTHSEPLRGAGQTRLRAAASGRSTVLPGAAVDNSRHRDGLNTHAEESGRGLLLRTAHRAADTALLLQSGRSIESSELPSMHLDFSGVSPTQFYVATALFVTFFCLLAPYIATRTALCYALRRITGLGDPVPDAILLAMVYAAMYVHQSVDMP